MYKQFGKIAICVLCISLLLTSAVFAKNFKDVNDWSKNAVDRVSDYGLMVGVGGGYFAPGETITQKEVASVLYRLADKPWHHDLDDEFADVTDKDAWYYKACMWAGDNGIINTVQQEQAVYLQPDREILRLEAAQTLYNWALYFDWIEPYTGEWKDNTELNGAADELKQVAAWALENKIWFGHDNGTFMPFETITRAEFAAMISRFMDRFKTELSDPHGVYTTTLYVAAGGDYTITNAEGETLICKDGKISGTMKYATQYLMGSTYEDIFYIKPSDRFTCKTEKGIEIFSIQSKNKHVGSIYGTAGVKEAVLQDDGKITVQGEEMKYELVHSTPANVDGLLYMSGEGETKASFTYDKPNRLYYAKSDTGRFSLAVSDSGELDRKDFVDQTEEICVSVSNHGTIEIESGDDQEAA